MALSTVPRYEPPEEAKREGRAVVVGGSVAGLSAARVLADFYPRVTIVERDDLPETPEPRRGVPQGPHAHALHRAGQEALETVLPGYGGDLLAAGGVESGLGSDWEVYTLGDTLAETPDRLPTKTASRPLIEGVLRRRVTELDAVRLRPSHHCRAYVPADGDAAVTGVAVQTADGETETLAADLVVDATGRSSRTPTWLENHGYAAPPTSTVRVDVAYSTVVVDRPPDDNRAFQVVANPHSTREAIALPIEDDRWVVVVAGRGEDHPPTDPEALTEFAAGLPTASILELLEDRTWLSPEVHHYRFPSNLRRRYEDVERFPDGLVVVGDAVASFNPVYGQGMSVAAMQALVLHRTLLDGGLDDVGSRFFERTGSVVDGPWFLAVGLDSGFPGTSGPTPSGTGSFAQYMAHVVPRAHGDGVVSEALNRVIQLEEPPSHLLRPAIVRRVLGGAEGEGRTGGEGTDGAASPTGSGGRRLGDHLDDPSDVENWPGFSTIDRATTVAGEES